MFACSNESANRTTKKNNFPKTFVGFSPRVFKMKVLIFAMGFSPRVFKMKVLIFAMNSII